MGYDGLPDVAPDVAMPLGFDTAVYDVMVEPLLFDGAVNETWTAPPTKEAEPIVGASGTAGVLKYGPVLAVLVPIALVAVNVTE